MPGSRLQNFKWQGPGVGCLEAEPALAGLCLPGKYSAGKLLVAGEMVEEIELAAGLGIQGEIQWGYWR